MMEVLVIKKTVILTEISVNSQIFCKKSVKNFFSEEVSQNYCGGNDGGVVKMVLEVVEMVMVVVLVGSDDSGGGASGINGGDGCGGSM